MATIGDLILNISVEGGQNVSNVLKNVGGSIQNIGKNLTNNLTKPIVGFFTKGIMLASDIGESMNVVNTVFGKSGKEVTSWSQDLLKSFGLTQAQALNYVGSMGAMLQSSGLNTKASQNMSQSLVELTGDMSSFYNLDHDVVWEKLRAGISGKKLPRLLEIAS